MSTNTPVYALPGTMCDERLWDSLETTFDVKHIAIPSKNNIDDIVDDIVALIPSEPIYLMGLSLGGYLASALCSAYPARIKKLCVIANSPASLPEFEIKQRRQLLNIIEKYGYSGIPKSKIASMLHTSNKDNQQLHKIISDMDNSFGATALIQQLKATSERQDLVTVLTNITTPIYFIHGEEDNLVNTNILRQLTQSRPSVKQSIAKNSGHMLPLENPKFLSQELNKWFT